MEYHPAETEAAIERLRERLYIDPRDIGAMRDLARLLEQGGDLPAAIDLHQRSLRVDPYRLDAMLDLGRLWRQLADPERATSWYRRALAIDPDCEEATRSLAAVSSDDGLSEVYIRTLFDQYADRFDDELTNALHYRAPDLVASLLARHYDRRPTADILDLGCGTGLSGVALAPFARQLDGVDLSPGMVGKAGTRNIYNKLTVGEAQTFLDSSTNNWDIIAAVDVLNYIGNLTAIFQAAARRLRPGGLLTGTVEKGKVGGSVLTDKRRHACGEDTLLASLSSADLRLLEMVEDSLRTESGAPVAGLIFVACRGPLAVLS